MDKQDFIGTVIAGVAIIVCLTYAQPALPCHGGGGHDTPGIGDSDSGSGDTNGDTDGGTAPGEGPPSSDADPDGADSGDDGSSAGSSSDSADGINGLDSGPPGLEYKPYRMRVYLEGERWEGDCYIPPMPYRVVGPRQEGCE